MARSRKFRRRPTKHRSDAAYDRAGCHWLVVYADREHFGNIMFLTGFEPRFEEALLLLGPGRRRIIVTGNESESYTVTARLPYIEVLLAQTLSLMGQDRTRQPKLGDRLADAGIRPGDSVGLVGWKYLEPEEDADHMSCHFVPEYFVQVLRRLVGAEGSVVDATRALMHPETGLRSIIDANQIAAFEWAAARCSRAVWRIVSGVAVGESEFSAVSRMNYEGDPLNVHTMFASAGRGTQVIGLRSPSSRLLQEGDGATAAVGMWGALSARAGLIAREDDGFLKLASAYFEGLLSWYETADIGVEGGFIYQAVASKLGEAGLRSALNPGHLTGREEWVHSPVRPGSRETIRSGMPFQVDIIPKPVPDGWALNCEDPVTFADEGLRTQLRQRHPAAYDRIQARRAFMRDRLGVALSDNLLPLSSTPLCLAPFWLRPGRLLVRG